MIRQSNRVLGVNSTNRINTNNINNNNNNKSGGMNWDDRPSVMNSRKESSHPNHATNNHFMRPQVGPGGSAIAGGAGLHDSDLPLRILVKSDMVGAIIGRSGGTIRQITQQTKARIDVHREDQLDQQDKVITINGSPKSCSDACFKIVEIILKEKAQANNNNNNNNEFIAENQFESPDNKQFNYDGDQDPEIQLKILAHNNLIGRLIGRKGASIKEIMEKTSTTIKISANSLTDSTSEHTITVTGHLEQVRQAESSISTKLRAAYVADVNSTLQTMNKSPYLFNNVPNSYMPGPYPHSGSVLSSLVGGSHQASSGGSSRGSHHHHLPHHHPQNPLYPTPGFMPLYPNMPLQAPGHGLLGYNHMLSSGVGGDFEKETVNLYIPNTMVGAIIGKSGSAIKEMISTSGASIKVAASAPPTSASSTAQPTSSKRDDNNLRSSNTGNNDDNSSKHQDYKEKTSSVELRESSRESNSSRKLEPESVQETSSKEETTTTSENQTSDGQPEADANSQPQNARHNHPHPRNSSHISNLEMRKVTIVGSAESQCTAQYLIYRKVSIESGKSDISLMVEIKVPSRYVGKIIGKGGSTVKQLQMQTRTTIRLPDERPPQPPSVSPVENGASVSNDTTAATEPISETCVQITGEFQGSQTAQRHIRNMVRESLTSAYRQTKAHQNKLNGGVGKTNAQAGNVSSNHNDKNLDTNSRSNSDLQSQGDIPTEGKSAEAPEKRSESDGLSSASQQHQDLDGNESPKQIDCPPSVT